ncbi:MAG: abortive infection family protein [Planctomycetota bacterium]
MAFDLAKAVVESACRTVLAERALAYSELDDLPKLFKNTTRHLPFLPAGTASAEARKGLEKTLSGLSTALQGICELRNECGFASHGAGSPRPHMEGIQALLAAQAADTIVGFLHRVHRQDYAAKQSMRPPYKDNPEFNEHVDETHGMFRVFDVELQPSKVLFEMEPESYRVYLAEFVPEGDGADPATSGQSEVSP